MHRLSIAPPPLLLLQCRVLVGVLAPAGLLLALWSTPAARATSNTPPDGSGSQGEDCNSYVSGWFHTTDWVVGDDWSPSWSGPWPGNTQVEVHEINPRSQPPCVDRSGRRWWGTWRKGGVYVFRGNPSSPPFGEPRVYDFGRNDNVRDIWWPGWPAPTGGALVAGYWYPSYRPGWGLNESVFQNLDTQRWTELGVWNVQARCEALSGQPISVSFSARNSTNTWSSSASGSSWAVNNALGPGPWTVTASYGSWSESVTLSNNGAHVFVVRGCGVQPGQLLVEARCSNTGALVSVGAFDAWSQDYNWSSSSPTGWYASSGYGSVATFTVPAGVQAPLHGRIWYGDGQSVEGPPASGPGETITVSFFDPILCTSPTSTMGPSGPTPTPRDGGCQGRQGLEGNRPPLNIIVPGAQTKVDSPVSGGGALYNAPSEPPAPGIVTPGQPLQLAWDFGGLGADSWRAYDFTHYGQAAIRFGLVDITAGETLIQVDFTDVRAEEYLQDNDGSPHFWDYALMLTKGYWSPAISWNGPQTFRHWNRMHASWDHYTAEPYANKWLVELMGRSHVTFVPVEGHLYEAWSVVGHEQCWPDHFIWARARFQAGTPVTINLRWMGMSGQDLGPVANYPITVQSVRGGSAVTRSVQYTSTGQGQVSFFWSQVVNPDEQLTVSAGIPAAQPQSNGTFLYDIDSSSCAGGGKDLQAGALRGVPAPCTITFFYVPLPVLEAQALEQDQATRELRPMAGVTLALLAEHGEAIATATTDADGRVRFAVSEAQARPRVGQSYWLITAPDSVGLRKISVAYPGNSAFVDAATRIRVSPISSSFGNTFIYELDSPPPPPPQADGQLYLNIHSVYDPQQGVYRSAGQAITWPQGEVLDFTPHVALNPLPTPPPGYSYRQRVVAWSLVKTTLNGHDRMAAQADDMQPAARSGCRSRETPTAAETAGADLSTLQGCVYRYRQSPAAADMARQAHALWSSFLPLAMRDDVYVYRLRPLAPASITLQVAVLVEVIDSSTGDVAINPATGQPVQQTQTLEGAFRINLVTPRSAR